MKKIISVVIAMILMATILCSCGSEEAGNSVGDNSTPQQDLNENTSTYSDVELSDDLYAYTIGLDEHTYKLPAAITDFTESGWSLPEYFDDADKPMNTNDYDSLFLSNNNGEIWTEVYNLNGNQKKLSECPIGSIDYDFSGSIQVYLAGKFLLNNATVDSIIAEFGEPTTNEIYEGVYIEVVYETPNSASIYERYTFYFDEDTKIINRFNMINFVKSDTPTENDSSDTGYLKNYKAPSSLGNDVFNYNVSVDGDLYTIPAPVSAFTDNGWEVIEAEDVGAGTYVIKGITLKRNSKTVEFNVYNFSSKQVNAVDATIYQIEEYDYDDIKLNVIFSGEIKLGMTKEAVLKKIGSTKLKENDFSEIVSYLYTDYQTTIEIRISKDTNTVTSITMINKVCNYKTK